MVNQWEKGLYEVVAGNGGVAINRVPVVDPRGFDPFAVFSYLAVVREALAITSKVIERASEYAGTDMIIDAVKTLDYYSRPLYEGALSQGKKALKIICGDLEKKVMRFF